ncbi:MAG: hypothetical protein KA310_03185 [Pseudomonadales bacterium]|nr:hypothetical protein [Pseudomonadales bacterium]
MTPGTAGPWTVEERDTRVEIYAGDVNVATITWPEGDDEAEATARADADLIAASPDLLAEHVEACDLLNALVGAMPPALQKKWPHLVRRSLEMSSKRSAIAKARGTK